MSAKRKSAARRRVRVVFGVYYGGRQYQAGEVVEVSQATADELLRRGHAVPVTLEEKEANDG